MTYKPISNRALSLWAFVAGFEGIVTAFFLVREPSEVERALAFGLSAERLLIVISVLLLALFLVVVAVAHFYRRISWNETINTSPKTVRYVLTGVFILELLILHILFLIPDYHFPVLSGYLSRLKPAMIWLALIFAQTFIFLACFGALSLESIKDYRGSKSTILTILWVGIIWGFVATTGIGIIPDDYYWNVAGVPLLAGQVWIAVGVTIIGWFLHGRFLAGKSLVQTASIMIFIGIWIIAAIVWINIPLGPTFNAPGPYLPTREFYPFVDAAFYDLGAQSAVYGKGLFFGNFMDRGLLSGFLALIHKLFGQNYLTVVGVQSAVFAIFPGLLYLLGEKLHSKSAGVMAATLAILKVANMITGGKFIGTSHPKLMLTEFPTGIVLAFVSIFLVKWLLEGNSKAYNLASVGAAIGVGILLRHNVFFMFPVVFMMGIVIWRQHWKLALRDVFFIAAAFFITISPWMWRNQRVAGEPFFFLLHFDRVIDERYQPQSNFEQVLPVSNIPSRSLQVRASISQTTASDMLDLNQYQFIPRHFVHNIIASVLILPPSPVLDDFRHVIDQYPYWGRMGNASLGDISTSMGLFLAANLVILSLGFGSAWKRVGFVALVPLAVFLFYNLASAFARTSGGRYIVPVDWVIYFYYAISLTEIIRFCISAIGFQAADFFGASSAHKNEGGDEKLNWGKAGLSVLPFFLVVAMLPIIEFASPGAKPLEKKEALIQRLDELSFFDSSGLLQLEVEEFLKNPDALIISGRGFYPRYYSYNQGESILPGQITPYTPREFPRLVFTLLLPDTNKTVLLPIDDPRLNFPDAAEVIVGGCQVSQTQGDLLSTYLTYIDAAFVVILDEPGEIYIRVPEAPLLCPLREPVCDNNRNCN